MAVLTEEQKLERQRETAALLSTINKVTGAGNTNKSMSANYFKKAGIDVNVDSNTGAVNIDGHSADNYTKNRDYSAKKRADMQKKKEDRLEVKSPVNSAQIKRDRTKKEYEDYVKSDEYKKRVTANEQRARADAAAQLFLNPGQPMPQPKVIQDEKEQQLRADMEQAEAEYNASEDQKVIEQDLEAITGLSNEERRQLEQYAVDQIRDQNLPIEMMGVMPTAQQETSGLIEKYGKQRVDELAETYMRQENARMAQTVDEQTRDFVNKRKGRGTLASAATIPVAAVSGLIGSIGQLQGMARNTGRYKTLDPNATGTIGDTFTGAVRGQVGENIVEDLGGGFIGKAASLGYQGVMSAADSIARAYLGGGAFGGAALAATNSFSQAMAEASRKGAAPAQAALLATTTAGIEALTEKIPLDNLIRTAKGQGFKNVILNALAQAGIEATTEEISLLGTVLAEAAILQEKSGYRRDVMTAIMNGMSPDYAIKQASLNIVDEAMNTALVSMVSGGVSSLGGSYADARGLPVPPTIQELAEIAKDTANNQQTVNTEPQKAPQQAQTEAVQQEAAQPDMQQEAPQQVQFPTGQQPSADPIADTVFEMIQKNAAPEVNKNQNETADYYDEFENWGADQNREGVENPLADRKYSEVGKRNVKAYMYENSAVKPFYQEQAAWLLSELADSTKGERTYNEQLHYESGGEKGWTGTSRHTSESIAELLDQDGMTYEQIEKGLNAIINDNGQENNAASKRIEFVINKRLMDGYTDFYTGQKVPGNAEYLNLLRNQQSAPSADMQMDTNNQSAERGQIRGTGAAERNFSGKPTYNAILSEDNAQPDRRNDVRPMELPATDVNGGNVSATTANVYGSQNTPDDLAAAMEEPVSRGDFSYVRISNDAATQRAQQTIGESGSWESARDNFRMDVDRGLAGAELSARGALILNHAAEVYEQAKASGDPQAATTAKREWLTILSDVQKLGTNTAQGLQALRIIRDLMPQDKMQFAQIAVQNMARDMKLGADIQIDQQLLTDYENATTDQQRDEIMEKIQQNVADQIPSTVLDKWSALRYTNMLGNLKTNVRNVAGNAANTVVYRFKDATGAVLESIANKVSRGKTGRTKSVIVNKQLQKAMDPYYQQVKNAISSGVKYGENSTASGDFSQGVMDKRQIFKFKPLESYRKATNWMMNNERFGDEAFGKTAFTHAMAGYLQANGVKDIQNASPELIDRAMTYAVKEAQETTFHDNSALANVLGKLKKDSGVVGEGLIPFTKTPANVLTRAEEYSPLGILNTAILSAQKVAGNTKLADANGRLGNWAARGQDITGTDIINSLSKTLTGSAIFAMGAILKSQGILNGGPDEDDEQEAFDKLNGIQPYSINLPNGTTYTLDWLTPVAMPLFMGAQLMDIASDKDITFADLEQVFTSIADPMIQMSMMQGINSSLESIKYSDNNMGQFFINAAVNYLTQGLTNTLLGQLERSTEENRMTTYVDKDSQVPQWMQQSLGKASQKIPGWDYQQTEYIDARGEKQRNEGGLAYELMSPGYSQNVRDDAVTREMNRLRKSTGENVFPNTASKTITYTDKQGTVHKDYNLSAEQYQTYAQTQGQTARELWEEVVNTTDFDALTDAQKVKVSEDIKKYSREVGEIAAIGKDNHTGYSDGWMQDVEKGGAMEIIQRTIETGFSSAKENLSNAWKNGYDEAAFIQEMETAFNSYKNASAKMQRQVYEESSSATKNYIDARQKGISNEKYLSVAKSLSKTGDTIIEKSTAIVKHAGLTDAQKTMLVKQNVSDAQDENIDLLMKMGYGIDNYVGLYSDYKNYTSGKGKKNRTINKWMKDYGISYAAAKKLYEVFP